MKMDVLKRPDFIYMYMWHLGTWFRGRPGCVSLIVGLNELKGHLQPK